MSQSPKRVQIFAAASNAAFADRLTQGLHAAGYEIVNGAFDPENSDAVVVVWSGSSITAAKLIEAARAPLAAGALTAVSIGRVEPPEAFQGQPPIDLAGWNGEPTDLRWRSVVDAVERVVAARRGGRAEAFVAPNEGPYKEELGDAASIWPQTERSRETAAFVPPSAPSRQIRLQPVLVLGLTLIAAIIFGGFVTLVSKRSEGRSERAPAMASSTIAARREAAPPILAVVEAAPISDAGQSVEKPREPSAPPTDEIAELIAASDVGEAAPVTVRSGAPRLFKDCAACPEMAAIPEGSFAMGAPGVELQRQAAEGPVVTVTFARPFALSTHEVSFAEWDACVAAGRCPVLADFGWGRGRQPAINVSWEDANAYAAWLAETTGARYRLPTEAEWEYAARAGAQTAFSFGEGAGAAEANFDSTLPYRAAAGPPKRRPLAVGSYAPSAFGLYDMHGNVWEWVADCWKPSHDGQSADGAARGGACAAHVLKGGAWNTGGWRLRAAHRIAKNSKAREYDNGFRVARDLE